MLVLDATGIVQFSNISICECRQVTSKRVKVGHRLRNLFDAGRIYITYTHFKLQCQSIRIKSPIFFRFYDFFSKFLEIIYNDGIKHEIGTSNPKF